MGSKWWPTSKVTAVGVTGVLWTWGVWALGYFYGVELDPFEVAANQAWVTLIIAYAITENRGDS